ncbi:L,D-transpeptidase [Gordonia sp. L191]|uniref:L,D-transpeptidase n=1 Tax=Gordonia TaxID=2053 RepID=UPI001AD6DAF0|nr:MULTISPECIES: L,D-transpeptidase [Gordonia]QTI66755.1 L,D-transpeptidase [Gordonia polyisoprenivorans]WHU45050.1 L,D-transpeptidase [Gordonia sp. L191]
MLNTTNSPRRRRGTSRLVAIVLGVIAMALALPGMAQAAPVTVIPGLPPVEIPSIPGLPTPPAAPPSTTTPPPTTTTPETPGVPAEPKVSTPTGWVALAEDSTHTIYWWKDGTFVKSMPISMGSDAHPTPNGVYHTKEKYRDMYMDSSTYGVPVDSPGGYRTYVEYATRMSWDGIFIHAAPWSLEQQGHSNVSHGCINVSTENGKWVYDTIGRGTPIVVRGTVGGQYTGD